MVERFDYIDWKLWIFFKVVLSEVLGFVGMFRVFFVFVIICELFWSLEMWFLKDVKVVEVILG